MLNKKWAGSHSGKARCRNADFQFIIFNGEAQLTI